MSESVSDLPGDNDRVCSRCEREIHKLEPATGMSLGGAVQANDLLVCNGCMQEFADWWDDEQEDDDE